MRYFLDTHAVIWSLTDTRKPPGKTRSILQDPRNQLYVSAVSFWEMAIKIRSGRLDSIGPWNDRIGIVEAQGFQTIPLLPDEAATSDRLTEDTHFDPFDRMLVWQAIRRDLILVSNDRALGRFKPDGLRVFWK